MTTTWNPSAVHPWASMKNGRLTADRQCVIFHIYRPWMYPETELLIRRIVLMRCFLLTFGGEFLGIWASHDSAPKIFHHPLWGVQSNGFYSWRFKWGFLVGNNMKQLKRHEMTYTAPIMPMKWIYFLICLVFACFDLILFCSSEKLQWWPWSPFPGDVTLTGLDSQTYLVWPGFLSLFFGERNLTALAGVLAVFTSLGKVPVAFCFGKVCNL